MIIMRASEDCSPDYSLLHQRLALSELPANLAAAGRLFMSLFYV